MRWRISKVIGLRSTWADDGSRTPYTYLVIWAGVDDVAQGFREVKRSVRKSMDRSATKARQGFFGREEWKTGEGTTKAVKQGRGRNLRRAYLSGTCTPYLPRKGKAGAEGKKGKEGDSSLAADGERSCQNAPNAPKCTGKEQNCKTSKLQSFSNLSAVLEAVLGGLREVLGWLCAGVWLDLVDMPCLFHITASVQAGQVADIPVLERPLT